MRALPLANERRYYVALGDAQSRDDSAGGVGKGVASLLQKRLAQQIPDLHLVPLATEGATAATVRYVQIPRLSEMNIRPSIVTMTLGAGELSRLAFGDAVGVCTALQENGNAALSSVVGMLAPNAILLLTNLYDPMDGTDTTLAQGVARFNETMAAIAQRYSTRLMDVYALFQGHGASVGDPLQIEPEPDLPALFLRAGADLAPVPNTFGALAIADAVFRSVFPAAANQ